MLYKAIALLTVLAVGLLLAGCPQQPQEQQTISTAPEAPQPEPAAPAAEAAKEEPAKEESVGPKVEGEEGKETKTTDSGLKYIVLEEGTGEKPKQGDTVVAEYTGWLTDGTKFDSSKDHPEAFSFPVGTGQVIPAWDEALLDMKVGERRKLIVPPDLAYGSRGVGPIPPNSTLVFEVKLVKIQ